MHSFACFVAFKSCFTEIADQRNYVANILSCILLGTFDCGHKNHWLILDLTNLANIELCGSE
jgi:hypothetical protein